MERSRTRSMQIRIQGSREDIKSLYRYLWKNKTFDIHDPSGFLDNKGTVRYKRLFAQIDKVSAKEQARRLRDGYKKETYKFDGWNSRDIYKKMFEPKVDEP